MTTCGNWGILGGAIIIHLLQALKGEEPLHTALLRNMYGNEDANKATAATLERYVLRFVGLLV